MFALLACLIVPISARAECIDWPTVMVKYDAEKLENWKTSILIQSFDDFTKVSGDDWLSYGISYLLSQYLSAGRDINAIFGPVARVTPIAVSPKFTLTGMYQHIDKKLRMFITLMQKGELVKQWQYDINYPQNNELFEALYKASLEIMKATAPRYDRDLLNSLKAETGSVPAYENYIRGLLIYDNFDPQRMEIAETWFEESMKADIHYQKAYQGLANLYTFMALYNKQLKKPYSSYLSKAQAELAKMVKFRNRPDVPVRPKKYIVKNEPVYEAPTNRFLLANSHFVAGLSAAGNKQWGEAASQFESAVTYAPEDAITWNYLADMSEKAGNKGKAADARKKASSINKCLQ